MAITFQTGNTFADGDSAVSLKLNNIVNAMGVSCDSGNFIGRISSGNGTIEQIAFSDGVMTQPTHGIAFSNSATQEIRIGKNDSGYVTLKWDPSGTGAASLAVIDPTTQDFNLAARNYYVVAGSSGNFWLESGNFVQGIAQLSTSATTGFMWIPSCNGSPTGSPSAPYTSATAMVADTSNNRLYVRVGSTWKYASLT